MTSMTEGTNMKNHLSKAFCSKCGATLESAKLVHLGDVPLAVVVHATCNLCSSENMVTITSFGAGVVPLESDLMSEELEKFVGAPTLTYKDVLKVHKKLSKESICKLMQKKEHSSVKKQKN